MVRGKNIKNTKCGVWLVVFLYFEDGSKNSRTPKSSISIGFSIINHPFWSFWKVQVVIFRVLKSIPSKSFGETSGTPQPVSAPKPGSRADVELLVRVID